MILYLIALAKATLFVFVFSLLGSSALLFSHKAIFSFGRLLGLEENKLIKYFNKIILYYIWAFVGAYYNFQFYILPIPHWYSIGVLFIFCYWYLKTCQGMLNPQQRILAYKMSVKDSLNLVDANREISKTGDLAIATSFIIFYFFPDIGNKLYFTLPEFLSKLFL
jgi:hypothetical protein